MSFVQYSVLGDRRARGLSKLIAGVLLSGASLLAIVGAAQADDAKVQVASAADGPVQLASATDYAPNRGGVESIVVTARHIKEDVQSVPIPVDVLGEVQIERSGQYNLNSLQISVPSLFASTANARNANINIRGLGSNVVVANDGLENGVGFYIDGVYYGRVGLSQFDLLDLEQVEVLHGPQGTLFGKNTTAGAINITTRKPTYAPEGQFVAQGGDFGFYQLQGSASGALLDDKIAGRISGGYTSKGGFIHNITTNQEVADYTNASLRGQLLANFTDNLELRFIADFQRQTRHGGTGVDNGVVTTYDNGNPIADNILQKAARFGYSLPTTNAWKRVTDVNSPVQANMEQFGFSLQGDLKLGDGVLTSITAYRQWNWYPLNDNDSTSLSAFLQGHITDHQQQFSQELRYAGTLTDNIDYQAGVYYFWQIIDGYTRFSYGPDAALFYLGSASVVNATALNNYWTGAHSTPETSSYAAFTQANWHITPELTLTGGLRYTYEDKQGIYDNEVLHANDTTGLTPAQLTSVLALRNAYSRVLAFDSHLHSGSLSSLVTLSYQWTPHLLSYATYSQGEKSGGLNLTQLPPTLLDPRVRPEHADNYEIGLKSQWFDQALTANVSLFWTEVSDYQTQVVSSTAPYQSAISNIPLVRSRGFEGSLLWAPLEKVSFGLGSSYTDAVYVDYPTGPAPTELGPTSVAPYSNLSGRPLASAPKWVITGSFDAAQDLGIAAPGDLGPVDGYIHADTRYQTSNYSAGSDSRYSLVKAYDLTNLRLGLRTQDSRWDISLYSNNLLNQRYFTAQSLATNGLLSASLGEPRNSGITLRIKF